MKKLEKSCSDKCNKYHLFECDHEARVRMAYSQNLEYITELLDNCGGYRP